MYEELVKLLRKKYDQAPMVMEAADAIEELSREAKVNARRASKWAADAEKAEKTRWIPVAERLPETRSSILGQKSSKVIVAFQYDDETQGTDTAHTLNGNWVFEDRITVVNRTVTHWMPLPETPKEEE